MRRRLLLIGACLAIILGGCSSGDDASTEPGDSTPAPTSIDPRSSSAGGTAAPAGEVVFPDATAGQVRVLESQLDVGVTVTYAGFEIAVRDMLIGADPAGFRVAQVNMTLTNHSNESSPLNSLVELHSQGTVSPLGRDGSPTIASGGTDSGFVSIRLDPAFTIEDAVLVIGRADRNQASVPLGSAGAVVTRTPTELEPLEPVTGTGATLAIIRSELRYDFLSPRGQTAIGEALLIFDWELTSEAATSLSDRDLRLRLPSGSEIEPVSATILSVDAGETAVDLSALFIIDDPPAGGYVLEYSARFGGGAVEVPFSIG